MYIAITQGLFFFCCFILQYWVHLQRLLNAAHCYEINVIKIKLWTQRHKNETMKLTVGFLDESVFLLQCEWFNDSLIHKLPWLLPEWIVEQICWVNKWVNKWLNHKDNPLTYWYNLLEIIKYILYCIEKVFVFIAHH